MKKNLRVNVFEIICENGGKKGGEELSIKRAGDWLDGDQ